MCVCVNLKEREEGRKEKRKKEESRNFEKEGKTGRKQGQEGRRERGRKEETREGEREVKEGFFLNGGTDIFPST